MHIGALIGNGLQIKGFLGGVGSGLHGVSANRAAPGISSITVC
jgi:hypothetical protein